MTIERLEEIKTTIAELEEERKPFWEKKWALEKERDKIYAQVAKEIVLDVEWYVCYEDRTFSPVYLEAVNNREVADQIRRVLKSDYHDSWTIEGDEDDHELVRLAINDGKVNVWFNGLDSLDDFKRFSQNLKLNLEHVDTALEKVEKTLRILRELI